MSSSQSYNRQSSVSVDEDNHIVVAQGERSAHETDEVISKILSTKHLCKWTLQRGDYIECNVGQGYKHGLKVHPDDRLQGTEKDGSPILVRIDVDKLTK